MKLSKANPNAKHLCLILKFIYYFDSKIHLSKTILGDDVFHLFSNLFICQSKDIYYETISMVFRNTNHNQTMFILAISCHLCRWPRFICERAHAPQICQRPEQQFCINDVENLDGGSRFVTRRWVFCLLAKFRINDVEWVIVA